MIESRIWKQALAPREGDDDAAPRERLRGAYQSFRERAALLAAEIARDLPAFAVHDGSHLDAAWELADLIAPADGRQGSFLTPAEAFVLGGAILLHDLGSGIAAFAEGGEGLRRTGAWQDALAALRMDDGAGATPAAELERRADALALRALHARHAERLCAIPWPSAGATLRLIEAPELLEPYGPAIGRIAHSCWWAPSELTHELPMAVDALPWMPRDWTVEPVKLACLLRVSVAALLDLRRSRPLRTLPAGPGDPGRPGEDERREHRARIRKPVLVHDRLAYAGAPFGPDEVEGWWMCHDLLRTLDQELREVDLLLAGTGRQALRARGVLGVDHPERLAQHVPASGWTPVDAQLRVSDVPALVGALGGEALYGHDPVVVLRELIQNASDAVQARRALEDRPRGWGAIVVRVRELDGRAVLEVEDDGLGMSARTLATALLDFGRCYWRSDEAREEYPGLAARGFIPAGRFGIGFHSVFMISDRLQVFSRRAQDGVEGTRVLEFRSGLRGRPVLRPAHGDEQLPEPGTRVRVELSPRARDEFLRRVRLERSSLAEAVAALAPALDVDLVVEEGGARTAVVRAGDWLTMPGADLVLRTTRLAVRNVFTDDAVTREQETRAAQEIGARLRPIVNEDGAVVGRACIPAVVETALRLPPSATVTAGGLRSGSELLWGVLLGTADTARRDTATPLASPGALQRWAQEQVTLLEALHRGGEAPAEALHDAADLAAFFGADPRDLPIARVRSTWMSRFEIERSTQGLDRVLFVEPLEVGARDAGPLELDDGMIVVEPLDWTAIPATSRLLHALGRHAYRSRLPGIVAAAVARAWSLAPGTVLNRLESRSGLGAVEIGTRAGKRVKGNVTLVLERPGR